MDAKASLIHKIKTRTAKSEAADRDRQTWLDSFKADFSDLHGWLLQLVEDIPTIEVTVLLAMAGEEVFEKGNISIELFGNTLTFSVAQESGKFGVNVDNLWSRRAFLTAGKMNLWGCNTPSGEQLVLTESVLLGRLDTFVDNPKEKNVQLWD
jgi:hypothetical protein